MGGCAPLDLGVWGGEDLRTDAAFEMVGGNSILAVVRRNPARVKFIKASYDE